MAGTTDKGGSLFRIPQIPRIRRSELRLLLNMLESPECNIAKFGEAISKHPAVAKQILRAANSSLTGSATNIKTASHAALYLGSRRVTFLLNTLAPELIEEDVAVSSAGEGAA